MDNVDKPTMNEGKVREALTYYQDLTQRARDYWDEWTGSIMERDRRYLLYQEYRSTRDALVWALGEGVASYADAPPHTAFPPDLLTK